MLKSRSLISGVLVVLVLSGGPAHADIAVGAGAFLKSLADQAVKSLTEADTTRAERIKRFRAIYRKNFAVRSIGKFVLGRNWRRTSNEERKEYLALLEDLMVVTYVDRFQRYAGEFLKVKKTRVDSKSIATVFSEIVRSDGVKLIRVDWRVGTTGNIYKVLDVIIEGTSMSNTLRSDFASTVRREGNQIGGLLAALRKKTAALNAEDN